MGTCCGAHLQTKVRDYAKDAQNGAVTVNVIENPEVVHEEKDGMVISHWGECEFCKAPAEYTVSYYPK